MNNLLKVLVLCVISLNIMGASLYADYASDLQQAKLTTFYLTKFAIRKVINQRVEYYQPKGLKLVYYLEDSRWQWFDNPKGEGIIVVHSMLHEAWWVKLWTASSAKNNGHFFEYIYCIGNWSWLATREFQRTKLISFDDILPYIKADPYPFNTMTEKQTKRWIDNHYSEAQVRQLKALAFVLEK